MKKNLYYDSLYQRQNALLEWFLGFYFSISSWPRLLLEVFIRRNMGERYFSFFGVLVIFLLLVSPLLFSIGLSMFGSRYLRGPGVGSTTYLFCLFAALFLYAGIQRNNEIKRLPSVFDFKRFSMSTGDSILMLYRDKLPPWFTANPRRLATLTEPGVFLLLGVLLLFVVTPLGVVLVLCSIIYALSYVAAYRLGDHMVMDQIDKQICAEDFEQSFMDEQEQGQARGFVPYGRRPADPTLRRKVAKGFMQDDADEPVFAR